MQEGWFTFPPLLEFVSDCDGPFLGTSIYSLFCGNPYRCTTYCKPPRNHVKLLMPKTIVHCDTTRRTGYETRKIQPFCMYYTPKYPNMETPIVKPANDLFNHISQSQTTQHTNH